ncbi:amidohydrolase [Clostridium manihotivorum]|uniref:Amidohydrolase n=1 Tax=Clostridium manihotivorum TaxID=2320868 RepID=A0A410DVZ5_9CLOT|nr:amidohydrolase family protein [Clostridium manihotivorum]QAA33443.1 amidohydrolase [Clostridium manihotivorum]
MLKADIVLKSTNIFTSTNNSTTKGFVAITGEKILAVGTNDDLQKYIGQDTRIFELGNRVICPGFVDVHCFFTGYVLNYAGIDLSQINSLEELMKVLAEQDSVVSDNSPILGRNLNSNKLNYLQSNSLDRLSTTKPVILFEEGGESCYMNTAAKIKYCFSETNCYPEAYWRLLKDILNDHDFIVEQFKSYMSMLNTKGITAIKEMGFDDFYSFTDILEELENNEDLTLRVSFMSQPVGSGANLSFGKTMREKFKGTFIKFSGYNRMTDGSISALCGDLKEPYLCAPKIHCAQEIDYSMIEAEVLACDKEDFRFSLHAQGDAAIGKAIDIFSKCKKADGKLSNRHAITDVEFSDPKDLEVMGRLGIIAEVYPQIMSITNAKEKISMINEKIGADRGRYYWNRRKMADCNITISCGTDLPLMIPDIPESIYHTFGGLFPEGGEPFNKENTLTKEELLKAWTLGGQFNLGQEDVLGTLEPGKLADIAVLDGDIFKTDMNYIRDIKVCLTIVNGKVVYDALVK